MKVHVLGNVPPPNAPVTMPAVPSPPQDQTAADNAPVNPNGPVVMPPANAAPSAPAPNPSPTADAANSGPKAPRDADGTPAKVFLIINP